MNPQSLDSHWKNLLKAGGIAALVMLAIMIAQIIIFVVWPPPTTVDGFFSLLQDNWLLGLLSLDLLYLVNNGLLILIYLALYVVLKREAESAMLIGLVLGLVGIAAYYASNPAFEMLSLSNQMAAASSAAQRAIFQAAGQALLETYRGTAFNVYYVLNAAALLILAVVMLRSEFFTRATAILGIVAGVLMVIPSTAGMIGLIFSLVSLAPWAAFLVLIARKFLSAPETTVRRNLPPS